MKYKIGDKVIVKGDFLNEIYAIIAVNNDQDRFYDYEIMKNSGQRIRRRHCCENDLEPAPDPSHRCIGKKNEIKVGDEIILNGDESYLNGKAVVLTYESRVCTYNVLVANGDTEWVKKDAIECKTGRHFKEISKVLNQL